MAISFTRYVDITSSVGGAALLARRDLIGRMFTSNNLLPPNSFIEFTNIADVGTYFGSSSTEYLRAAFYFGWVSKNNTKPEKLSFARWVETAVAPRIYGNVQTQNLATYTGITAGAFGLTIGADVNVFTGINFSAATSLADVASILQTKIRTATGTMWTAATVTYDATRKSFNFVGGDAVSAVISVQAGVSNDIAAVLGWLTGSTLIVADGAAIESITDVLTNSANASDNFGSFLFIPTLSIDEVTEAAIWTNGQNVKFMFCVPVISANASAYSTALIGYSGVAVTLSNISTQYPEQIPMMIMAATNYESNNSVQNYMFQIFNGLSASVTTDSDANLYDPLRINYYGNTQQAGQIINFYQIGSLMGGSSSPVNQNTFANEIWLKSAAGVAIMNLLLSSPQVAANQQGRSQILTTLQGVINQALNNGTISVGKTLTDAQKGIITTITGNNKAWYQVQTIGYWVDCVIESYVEASITKYKAVYTLIYSKDDTISKVVGEHILI